MRKWEQRRVILKMVIAGLIKPCRLIQKAPKGPDAIISYLAHLSSITCAENGKFWASFLSSWSAVIRGASTDRARARYKLS